VIGIAAAQDLVEAYLGAKFTREARHMRRLAKVTAMEAQFGRSPKAGAKKSRAKGR